MTKTQASLVLLSPNWCNAIYFFMSGSSEKGKRVTSNDEKVRG